MKDLKDTFEKAISRQEILIMTTAHKFDDESQQQFYDKIARRIRMVCVGIGHARQYPGIDAICKGLSAEWQGFYIQRRRVDQLDNIYVSRLHV